MTLHMHSTVLRFIGALGTDAQRRRLEVTSKVIQVVGGRGAYRDFPAERALRDVKDVRTSRS